MNPCSELSFDPRRQPWNANFFFVRKREMEEFEEYCTAEWVNFEAIKHKEKKRVRSDPTEPSREQVR